jgi:thiol-disulfide isomerase/thioredoxin
MARDTGTSSDKTPRGPGFLIYIAGMAVAAIAGFAVAELVVPPAQHSVPLAERPMGASAQSAQAAEKDTGLDKLVVHSAPRAVPDFSFIDGEGETRTLADWRGKLLLVNIWATWCAPCKEEMPALDRLQAELGGDAFAVLPISVDQGGLDKPRAFLQQIGADNLPLLLDETSRLNFTVEALGLPATLIIDAKGREVARMIGPAEWDSPEAIAQLRQFMAAEG